MILKNARSRFALLLITTALIVAAESRVTAQTPEATPANPEPGVVREVLSHGTPGAAPGENLELVQYTIPPQIELPVHTHPGMQVSEIISGTLHYTVVEGEMHVYRAGAAEPESITPEDGEVAFNPGDAIVEPEGMVHKARNTGAEPIVIITASLLESDEPPAEIIPIEATPAA